MTDIIKPPWTMEQIDALASFQESYRTHPFTCGGKDCRAALRPTRDGWVCPVCDYTQGWAWAFMEDRNWNE